MLHLRCSYLCSNCLRGQILHTTGVLVPESMVLQLICGLLALFCTVFSLEGCHSVARMDSIAMKAPDMGQV